MKLKKLESEMASHFKNTEKVILISEEGEENFTGNTIRRFCQKNIESGKVRDQCHLTSKCRCPAHNKCNISVTQKQSIFIAFAFHIFSI